MDTVQYSTESRGAAKGNGAQGCVGTAPEHPGSRGSWSQAGTTCVPAEAFGGWQAAAFHSDGLGVL